MKKDFETIKEMANKKLLNFEQKKVLSTLFESKINTKERETRAKQNEELRKAEKSILIEIGNRAEVKKALSIMLKAEQDIKESEKVLVKNSVRYENESYNDKTRKLKLTSGSYSYGEESHYPEALEKMKTKHQEKIEKISELKLKLKADIYALPMAYSEINEYIENELNKV